MRIVEYPVDDVSHGRDRDESQFPFELKLKVVELHVFSLFSCATFRQCPFQYLVSRS
jgi:hypothetical protein